MSRLQVLEWLLHGGLTDLLLIGCVAHILPTLQKYIELRSRLAGENYTDDSLQPGGDTIDPTFAPTHTRNFTKPPITIGKGKAESSRDMAQQIALLSEEILRTSQEKVNIAQTNCDSVLFSIEFSLDTLSHFIG
jgi:hypothetical protein